MDTGEGGQCQDMDQALFRNELLKNMAPTWHRNGGEDGVVLGFAKPHARLMVEGRAAAHSRSRIAASRWADISLVISLPQQKLNCFLRDRFGFLGRPRTVSGLNAAVQRNNSKERRYETAR